MALAYDTKRDQLLVPNRVTQPRIAVFARRQTEKQRRPGSSRDKIRCWAARFHGLAYDPMHDEIVAPNALADAVWVFRGAAAGSEHPLRVIQGRTRTDAARRES